LFDSLPRESELRSWTWVGLGIAVIYTTIPLARALQRLVNEYFGRELFLYVCLLALAIGARLAWRSLRQRRMQRSAYWWLGLVFSLLVTIVYKLRAIPEEALHVVQYSALGVLIYRAFAHRAHDYTIYPLAALATGVVGVVDEYIQWVVPARYFDTRDIYINFFSGVLAQAGIALGMRPRLVAYRPDLRNWGRLSYCVGVALIVLLPGFINSPQRVAGYAKAIPALEFLLNGNSTMAEYGYRHRSPAGGEFRSRFEAEKLAELDRRRGSEVANALDYYLNHEGYYAYLTRYSVILDPYAHEFAVHMRRRQYHYDRTFEPDRDYAAHYTIAFFENDILHTFYPNGINASPLPWDDATTARVADGARREESYVSAVSSNLITRVDESEVLLLFAIGISLSFGGGAWLSRRGRAA